MGGEIFLVLRSRIPLVEKLSLVGGAIFRIVVPLMGIGSVEEVVRNTKEVMAQGIRAVLVGEMRMLQIVVGGLRTL